MHYINSVNTMLDYTPQYLSYFQLPCMIAENNLLIISPFMFVYKYKMQERNFITSVNHVLGNYEILQHFHVASHKY